MFSVEIFSILAATTPWLFFKSLVLELHAIKNWESLCKAVSTLSVSVEQGVEPNRKPEWTVSFWWTRTEPEPAKFYFSEPEPSKLCSSEPKPNLNP